MANVRQIINRVLIAGGLAMSVGSTLDLLNNTVLRDENSARALLEQALSREHGVKRRCESTGGGFPGSYCTIIYANRSLTDEEEKETFKKYMSALDAGNAQIPHDAEAAARGDRDFMGLLGGFGLFGVGGLGEMSPDRGSGSPSKEREG